MSLYSGGVACYLVDHSDGLTKDRKTFVSKRAKYGGTRGKGDENQELSQNKKTNNLGQGETGGCASRERISGSELNLEREPLKMSSKWRENNKRRTDA